MQEVIEAVKILNNIARGTASQRDIPHRIGKYNIRKIAGARPALSIQDHPHVTSVEMESKQGTATVLMHRIELPLALIGNRLTTIASLADGHKDTDRQLDQVITGDRQEVLVDRIQLATDENSGDITHEHKGATLRVRRLGANLIIEPRTGKGNVRLTPDGEAALKHILEMHERAVKRRAYIEFKN